VTMDLLRVSILNRAGGEPCSQGSGDRSAFRAPSAKRVTRDGQPPTLKQASLNRIGQARQSFSTAQMGQVENSLPAHLRGQVSETMRVANLTDLPDYRAALAAIPPAALTRPRWTQYQLPAPYNLLLQHPTSRSGEANYEIGGGYMLSGNYGVPTGIRGPNGFKLIIRPGDRIYQSLANRYIPLDQDAPFLAKFQMMDALRRAAIAAQRGLGPRLGVPQASAFM
jgi:hypothetical protein